MSALALYHRIASNAHKLQPCLCVGCFVRFRVQSYRRRPSSKCFWSQPSWDAVCELTSSYHSNHQVFRCYRYGQEKSVFVYRLMTQGTMEEKIYSRAVNKSTLASSVNDGKDLLRLFTAQEVSNINAAPVSWVQCDQVRLRISASPDRQSRVAHPCMCFFRVFVCT